jgi:catechol 2,3-dioxygenase-like lactoylglutathione lyase family enzyme
MPLNALTPELYCSTLEKSLAFYRGILGFKVLYQRAEEKFAYLEREGAQLMLEELGVGRRWITAKLAYPFGAGVNFQIAVSDVTALHKAIKRAGCTLYMDMEEKWYRRDNSLLGNRQFLIQDPDGYLLRFAQDLGSKPVDKNDFAPS